MRKKQLFFLLGALGIIVVLNFSFRIGNLSKQVMRLLWK